MSSFPAFNHYALTVSNLQRSIEWYERLFESPPVAIVEDDTCRAAMSFEPMFAIHENQHHIEGDVFDEFRIGLDHIAFGCASREELESWPTATRCLGYRARRDRGSILRGRSRISGPGQRSARVLSADGLIRFQGTADVECGGAFGPLCRAQSRAASARTERRLGGAPCRPIDRTADPGGMLAYHETDDSEAPRRS